MAQKKLMDKIKIFIKGLISINMGHGCFSIKSNNTVLLNDSCFYGAVLNYGSDLIIENTSFIFDKKIIR